jgi:hypothetical protein
MSSGEFTRMLYDNCETTDRVLRSGKPLLYKMYRGQAVNCNRCQIEQEAYIPLIDMESELRGINRLASKCSQFKYLPNCKFQPNGQNICVSTFDKLVPISLPPQTCPLAERMLYFNNGLIRPQNLPKFPSPQIC